jgi:hypothetical protein
MKLLMSASVIGALVITLVYPRPALARPAKCSITNPKWNGSDEACVGRVHDITKQLWEEYHEDLMKLVPRVRQGAPQVCLELDVTSKQPIFVILEWDNGDVFFSRANKERCIQVPRSNRTPWAPDVGVNDSIKVYY